MAVYLLLLSWFISLSLSDFIDFPDAGNEQDNDHDEPIIAIDDDSDTTISIPTSCKGLEDGYHFIKLMEDDVDNDETYPILYVQCSNHYAIINQDLDDDWQYYFYSWRKYHYGIVGPIENDHSNWVEWFTPSRKKSKVSKRQTSSNHVKSSTVGKFIVSPDCDTCDAKHKRQLNHDLSSYYMSPETFGCNNGITNYPACSMDYDTYECKVCEWNEDSKIQISSLSRDETQTWESINFGHDSDELTSSGACSFEIRGAGSVSTKAFTKCVSAQGTKATKKIWKPSLGIDGRYCTCFQPAQHGKHPKKTKYTSVSVDDLSSKKTGIFGEDASDEATWSYSPSYMEPEQYHKKTITEDSQSTELYSSDFESGTYRITTPGYYKIMEDISFNFNGPSDDAIPDSPNNVHDMYWWPKAKQLGKYSGAGQLRNPYFLGFFAGIAVECNNVVIDLNGFELRMSRELYYQQPYFSIIELANQAFLPSEGPGFFGPNPMFAKNVIVKDGTLGLSSHHGIHGNKNEDIVIDNVVIKEFQTHGIQLNGFDSLTISNVEIGPSSQSVFLNANYAQMRAMLPIVHKVAVNHPDESKQIIKFTDGDDGSDGGNGLRSYSLEQVRDELITMMDIAFKYVVYGVEDTDNEFWSDSIDTFVNPTGLPLGAVIYGLYLNYPSPGIDGWHVSDDTSSDAVLENVYIHDLRHSGTQVVGIAENGRLIANSLYGPLPLSEILGNDQFDTWTNAYSNGDDMNAYYKGSIVTDVHLSLYYFGMRNWDNFPGTPFYGKHHSFMDFAMGEKTDILSSADSDTWSLACSQDAMMHSPKGLIGMKISGVDGVTMSGITIKDLQDETPLGTDICGNDEGYEYGYTNEQQMPYQEGYSLNMVMGMSVDWSSSVEMEDISISNLYSDTGLVYGMPLWFETDIEMSGDISINNLFAGVSVIDDDDLDLSVDSLPNRAPEVCTIRMYETNDYALNIETDMDVNIEQRCISGSVGCLGVVGDESDLCDGVVSDCVPSSEYAFGCDGGTVLRGTTYDYMVSDNSFECNDVDYTPMNYAPKQGSDPLSEYIAAAIAYEDDDLDSDNKFQFVLDNPSVDDDDDDDVRDGEEEVVANINKIIGSMEDNTIHNGYLSAVMGMMLLSILLFALYQMNNQCSKEKKKEFGLECDNQERVSLINQEQYGTF